MTEHITGIIDTFTADVDTMYAADRKIPLPKATTLSITIPGDLNKTSNLDQPITITQEPQND